MVVKEDDNLALLTNGYRPFEQLQPAIDHWLEHGFEKEAGTTT